MTKQQIADAQSKLNALGYNAGTVDGIIGPNTRAAVKEFQKEYGLVVDGILGPNTYSTLKSEYSSDVIETEKTGSSFQVSQPSKFDIASKIQNMTMNQKLIYAAAGLGLIAAIFVMTKKKKS